MKKVIYFLVRALVVISLPALMILLIMFAYSQTFGIGLVILLGLVLIQLLLSRFGDKDKYIWSRYDVFSLEFLNYGTQYEMAKVFNIFFNLTKVATVISLLFFSLKSGVSMNLFGDFSLTTVIVFGVIAVLLFLFIRKGSDYQRLRGALAVITLVTILTFIYLYFGTQLIWVPVGVVILFAIGNSFTEIEDGDEAFSIVVVIISILIGLISTVIQFCSAIWEFILSSVRIIIDLTSALFTFEILFVPLWLYLSIFIISFIVVKIAKASARAKAQKQIDFLNLQKSQAEKEVREKARILEDNKRKEFASSLIREANIVNSEHEFTFSDLMFVRNNSLTLFNQKDTTQIFTRVNLFKTLVTVSHVKQQIYYLPNSWEILNNYNDLYKKSIDDVILKKLITVIDELIVNVMKVKTYKGSDQFIIDIKRTCKDFPRFAEAQK